MNSAPKGKIGRLPKAIQEQVNRRLEQGEQARTLVAWLNTLPEVQSALAAEFAGKPIREQNLSGWRKYRGQWLPDGKIRLSLLHSACFISHGACRLRCVLASSGDRP